MMAMQIANLSWHIQVGTTNIGSAVQQAVNALLARVCKYAVVAGDAQQRGTYQNLPALKHRAPRIHTLRLRGLAGHGIRLYPLAERHNQNREKM